jgi:hypothetical protein
MMLRAVLWSALLTSCLAGCHRDEVVRCEDPSRYRGSASAAPVRVPDDLTPPDESEALSIPPPPAEDSAPLLDARRCLESPPPYFEQGLPGANPGTSPDAVPSNAPGDPP